MQKPLRLLMISFSFPPDSQVGALRSAKFAKYLPENRIEPIVLSVQERFYAKLDRSIEIPSGLRIERTSAWKSPIDIYGQFKRRLARTSVADAGHRSASLAEGSNPRSSDTSGFRHWLRAAAGQIDAVFRVPDECAGWFFPAIRRASELIQTQQVDAIYSTSPPIVAHVVARHLKLKFKLPWIMDLRDPWTQNPATQRLPGWHQDLNRRLEADCVRRADKLVCNTERLRRLVLDHYAIKPERVVTITNGFDDLPTVPASVRSDFRGAVLHLGSLYAERKVDGFAAALADLLHAGKLKSNELRVVFVGYTEPQIVASFKEHAPELVEGGMLHLVPRVSWLEAQAMMGSARVLLLIQGDYVLQVPAKFYEYLRTGRPMFAVARAGALTDLIDQTGVGLWADPEDIESLGRNFEQILKWETNGIPHGTDHQEFHYRNLTASLGELIRSAVSPQNGGAALKPPVSHVAQPSCTG